MSNILKIIRLAKPYHGKLSIIGVTVLITALLQLAGPVLIKSIVDEIEKQVIGGDGDIARLSFLIALVFAAGIFGIVFESLNMRLGDWVNARIGKYLTEKFYRKIFTLPQRYFDSRLSGKIVNQLSRGIVNLQDFLGAMTNFILPAVLQTVFVIGVLSFYSIPIALLAFSIFPVYIYISHYSTKKWGEREVEKNKIEDVTRGRIQEVIANIKLVKSFNAQGSERSFLSSNLSSSVKIYDSQSTMYHIFNFARNFGLEIVLILIAILTFRQTFNSMLSIGEMVLIIQLLGQLRRPLFAMSFILERIQRAEAGSKEYFGILELESVEHPKRTHTTKRAKKQTLEFKNVSFEYSKGEEVMKEVSFSIGHGETIALVGHSGAGKTTITNLILKFYDPTSGSILLNGKDYASMSHQDVRDQVSLVFQDSELFSTTIRDNIAYGKHKATDKEIIQALKKANAYEFVMKFPDKLATEIGERGVKLSGGQRQRVQIARAILHNAPILILDEATSSLDAKSEKLVQEALDNLMKDKLVIIIAHRFSTIQNADRVLVLENGALTANEKPQTLAAKKGVFSELLRYQVEGNQKLLEQYGLS